MPRKRLRINDRVEAAKFLAPIRSYGEIAKCMAMTGHQISRSRVRVIEQTALRKIKAALVTDPRL